MEYESLLVLLCIVMLLLDVGLIIYCFICGKIFMSDNNLFNPDKLMSDLHRWSRAVNYVRVVVSLSTIMIAMTSLVILK